MFCKILMSLMVAGFCSAGFIPQTDYVVPFEIRYEHTAEKTLEPAKEYGTPEKEPAVPEKEYGTPEKEHVPAKEYGVPEQLYTTAHFSPVPIAQTKPALAPAMFVDTRSASVPAMEYGTPEAEHIVPEPEKEYGVPAMTYGVPEKEPVVEKTGPYAPAAPIKVEEPVIVPHKEYGVPAPTKVVFAAPTTSYIIPQTVYTVPIIKRPVIVYKNILKTGPY